MAHDEALESLPLIEYFTSWLAAVIPLGRGVGWDV